MPNGRTGSLFLNKTEFADWLSRRDDDEIVGRSVAPATAVSVATVTGMLASFPLDRVAVEEQHATAYVVHLYHPFDMDPPDMSRWILIKPELPLFEELRRRHHGQSKWGGGSL
jgi:hypothetical protein